MNNWYWCIDANWNIPQIQDFHDIRSHLGNKMHVLMKKYYKIFVTNLYFHVQVKSIPRIWIKEIKSKSQKDRKKAKILPYWKKIIVFSQTFYFHFPNNPFGLKTGCTWWWKTIIKVLVTKVQLYILEYINGTIIYIEIIYIGIYL